MWLQGIRYLKQQCPASFNHPFMLVKATTHKIPFPPSCLLKWKETVKIIFTVIHFLNLSRAWNHDSLYCDAWFDEELSRRVETGDQLVVSEQESFAGQSKPVVRRYGGSVGWADVKGQQNCLVWLWMRSVSESSIYLFSWEIQREAVCQASSQKKRGKGHPSILLQYIKTELLGRGGKKPEEAKEQRKHSLMLNFFRALLFYLLKALL